MDPRAQLAEAIKRIARLIDVAAGPARREAARISSEAASLKSSRATARLAADAAEGKARRMAWVPFLGARLAAASAEAEAAARQADQAWRTLKARAQSTADVLDGVKKAKAAAARGEARLRRGDPAPAHLAERISQLLARIKFLEGTEGREVGRGAKLAPKVFALAAQIAEVARDWDGRPAGRPAQSRAPQALPPPSGHNRPVEGGKGRKQLALDFDGTGQVEEEPRIWLPISTTRTREMIERGARVDRSASRRGSQLFIPVSDRHNLDPYLPLAFRRQHTAFAFPPIRHNAVGQNLWSVFDQSSWNHIRTTAYDRAGHRCQICGKQGGSLWSRITPKEERKGVVDAHEVWEWEVLDEAAGIGIQRLKRILVVCKDCHMIFHEGRALAEARKVGLEDKAADYIKALRMAVNRCDGATLEAQLELDKAEWDANKEVGTWVLDLSHLATQDYMADHTLVLKDDNKAGITPNHVGGINFRTEDGTAFASQDARSLADGNPPKPTRPGVR